MPGPGSTVDAERVQRQVRDHMMLSFTDMNDFKNAEIPVFVRGEDCHVIDVHGRRFIDGLSGLFCSNLGHSFGAEIGDVAKAQLQELAFTPTWYVGHPRAAELSERIAGLTPPGLNRMFFTTGGAEANEAMWKMVRQWHQANGQPQRVKAIARNTAYHGTSLGALSFTGIDFCRDPFLPLPIDVTHVSETNAYRHPSGGDEAAFTRALLEEMEQAILAAGPDEVALIIAEPVQNSGGCFVPPAGYWAGLRVLADRYGILLTADEVITGFGRVGEWFGSIRYDIEPDFIIFAKGATAGMAPLGGVIVHDRVAETFSSGKAFFNHGVTYSGHPVSTAIAHKVIDIYERENVIENVQRNEVFLTEKLNELRRVPLVGDVRGVGQFFALELVKDRATKQTFRDDEADWLLRQVLSTRLYDSGLLCRLDDRGEPVIQLSPPL
ncbi:MAG: aminotransferase class III-fold pyridoxal phosphate-dependent enzyme, partial [Candidatus Nanopelagicales bacterium]